MIIQIEGVRVDTNEIALYEKNYFTNIRIVMKSGFVREIGVGNIDNADFIINRLDTLIQTSRIINMLPPVMKTHDIIPPAV